MKFTGVARPRWSIRRTFTVPARPRMKTKPRTPTSGGEMIGMSVRYEKTLRPQNS